MTAPLDEKALDAALAPLKRAVIDNDTNLRRLAMEVVATYLAALPVPGDVAGLVERLRGYRPRDEWGDPVHHMICDEATDTLTRLARENETLRGERNNFKDAFSREQQCIRDIVTASGPRDDDRDIFDHIAKLRQDAARAEAAEASLAECRRLLAEKDKALELADRRLHDDGYSVADPVTQAVRAARDRRAS